MHISTLWIGALPCNSSVYYVNQIDRSSHSEHIKPFPILTYKYYLTIESKRLTLIFIQ